MAHRYSNFHTCKGAAVKRQSHFYVARDCRRAYHDSRHYFPNKYTTSLQRNQRFGRNTERAYHATFTTMQATRRCRRAQTYMPDCFGFGYLRWTRW